MSEIMCFILFIGIGCSLWVVFYGKKVKKDGSKRRKISSKKQH
ncbi:hypothetical protein [Vagococcus fluvialis]|nr:hypothetical protein [Vagococcus fluvialis]MDT2747011.1 hypothetical protein [Vagococcus fluvialis]